MKYKTIISVLMGTLYGGLLSGILLWISLKTNRPIGLLVFVPIPTGLIIAYTDAVKHSTITGKDYKASYISFLGFLESLSISICSIAIFKYTPYSDSSIAQLLIAAIIIIGTILGVFILNRQYRQWLALRERYKKFVELNRSLDNSSLAKQPYRSIIDKIKSFQFDLPKLHPYILIVAILIFVISYYFLKNGDNDPQQSLVLGISSFLTFLFLLRIYFDYLSIADYIYRHNGNLMLVTWVPFGPGWLGERFPSIYLVKYKDDSGIKNKYCKAGILKGVYFTDDETPFY